MVARTRSWLTVATVGLMGLSSGARADFTAEEASDRLEYGGSFEPSPVDALNPVVPPPRLTVHAQVGMFSPGGEAVQTVYPGRMTAFGITAGYFVLPELSVGLGIGLARQTGIALGETSGRTSDDEVTLRIIPVELGATYRLSRLELPYITPYVAAGLTCHTFREVAPDSTISGGKWGGFARAGLGYRIETGGTRAWTSDANRGIRGTLITVEAGYSIARAFGGLDLSGFMLRGGLGLDF